jgi:hypothetical protein
VSPAPSTERDGQIYCNDGDWVESCTALVESSRGELSLLQWTELTRSELRLSVPIREAA